MPLCARRSHQILTNPVGESCGASIITSTRTRFTLWGPNGQMLPTSSSKLGGTHDQGNLQTMENFWTGYSVAKGGTLRS